MCVRGVAWALGHFFYHPFNEPLRTAIITSSCLTSPQVITYVRSKWTARYYKWPEDTTCPYNGSRNSRPHPRETLEFTGAITFAEDCLSVHGQAEGELEVLQRPAGAPATKLSCAVSGFRHLWTSRSPVKSECTISRFPSKPIRLLSSDWPDISPQVHCPSLG